MANSTKKTLRLILGDQLNLSHSWFGKVDDSVTYVLMEIRSEIDYVCHHIQKVLGFFAAMRHFAQQLRLNGHQVVYWKINDVTNLHSFSENCSFLIEQHQFTQFEYMQPDEYRVDQHLRQFTAGLSIAHNVVDTEHFYSTRHEFATFFNGKKTFLMESFYRYMRKKHAVLTVNGDQPLHGKWNFDAENRKSLPKGHRPPPPLLFDNNLADIESEIKACGIATIGQVDSQNFLWPISREQSLQLLDFFAQHCLPLFGTFQDAMAPGEWSLYHSRLSFSLNLKIISPQEVINYTIDTYQQRTGEIAYHQVEGFVRQILGWREYMRGIYWLKMPEYATLNYFSHEKPLPSWFWDGNTRMNCLKNAIKQSLQLSYAHHIQRLMLTGNFALLAGVHPDEVDRWYLGIYIDAIEWVEITNTRGMSQFADGGIVGTKPYVSSAAYINKMSSYCSGCHYDKSLKTGEKACPFNSLYWNFYHRHEDKLATNPRIGMAYNLLKKMPDGQKSALLQQADYYLQNLDKI